VWVNALQLWIHYTWLLEVVITPQREDEESISHIHFVALVNNPIKIH
jgi:hypothetical protein